VKEDSKKGRKEINVKEGRRRCQGEWEGKGGETTIKVQKK